MLNWKNVLSVFSIIVVILPLPGGCRIGRVCAEIATVSRVITTSLVIILAVTHFGLVNECTECGAALPEVGCQRSCVECRMTRSTRKG
jgi:hypothetical protein